MDAIEIIGLRKTFGDVVAVDGIDLTVRSGEIFGFLGPNGAGKSTTTKILTTLLAPTGGRATVAGYDLATQAHEIRLTVGVALQEAGLDQMQTGRELLELQARLHGLRGGAPKARTAQMLELVGLADAADRRVGTYSGGMRRRLDLASALIHGPSLLFLDEPTTGLDPASRQAIWDEVARLNREDGITVFLTTQYLEEADKLSDRVAIIDHGKIVAQGTPEELKAQIGSEVLSIAVPDDKVVLAQKSLAKLEGLRDLQVDGSELTAFVADGAGAVAAAVRLLDKAKVPVGSIRLSQPTLDEVFLRVTGARLEGADAEGGVAP